MARVKPDGEAPGGGTATPSPLPSARNTNASWAKVKEAINTANDSKSEWLDTMQDAKRLSILEKHRKRRKILSPEDRIVFVWNMICAFAVIFVAIELPIRLSFPLNVDEKVYLIGEWVLTIFFSVDIATVFVTAFEDEEGELFIDPFRVALRYARTWLIVDVIGKRIP